MIANFPFKLIATSLVGLVTGAAATYILLINQGYDPLHRLRADHHDDEYHIHADLLIMMGEDRIDLTNKKYQSYLNHVLHPGVHLHDENDDVIHFHAPGITLPEFFSSIGITLTDQCFTKEETSWCNNDTKTLQLFVNGRDTTNALTSYVPKDEDQVLLFYGPVNDPAITTLENQITTDACLYSGTCPERGTAPPESCGLTCEL